MRYLSILKGAFTLIEVGCISSKQFCRWFFNERCKAWGYTPKEKSLIH